MRRRAWLALPLLAGCSVLPERDYAVRRDWPLVVRRPAGAPATPGRLTLLVRAIDAGPGLAGRGLQSVQPDGSVKTDYYEQWVVPPAQAVAEQIRQWLAESGRFTAVLAPGSRAPADLVLEGELTALATGPDAAAHAGLAYALLDERAAAVRVVLQRSVAGRAPVTQAGPGGQVAAMEAALAEVFAQVEQGVAAAVGESGA